MFQETNLTTDKESPQREEEEQGKESKSVQALRLPSIHTILKGKKTNDTTDLFLLTRQKEQEVLATERQETSTVSRQNEKSRVQSELQPSWEDNSSLQPLSKITEWKTSEQSFPERVTTHVVSEDVTRGFEMPPLNPRTVYSQRNNQPTIEVGSTETDILSPGKAFQVSEPGQLAMTSRTTTQVKEETTERKTPIYPGVRASNIFEFHESFRRAFTGPRSSTEELFQIPRIQSSPVSEGRKISVKSVSPSSSDWREVGEESYESHSLEQPGSSAEPRATLASTSTQKVSHLLSEKDKHALRLMRNRLSAERSRNRKRERMQALEQEVRQRDETIAFLREDLNALLLYVERLEAFCKVLDVPSSELNRPELHYNP